MTSLVDQVLSIDAILDQNGVSHAFGGALALAYYTRQPRATNDIDINIALGVGHVTQAFKSLSAEVRWNTKQMRIAEELGEVKLRWMRQNSVHLFFVTHEFHNVAHKRTELVPFSGSQIPILSATDLTVFKAKFGREKDWLDIKEMLRADTVDIEEALRWVGQLVGTTSQSYVALAEVSAVMKEISPKE